MVTNKYDPDWVSPPWETIEDILEEVDLNKSDLSRLIGMTPEIAEAIFSGDQIITHEIASALSAALGSSVEFWLNRESRYREYLGDSTEVKR